MGKLERQASGDTAHAALMSQARRVLLFPQPARWPSTAAAPEPRPALALMLGPPCSRAGTARCGLPAQATGLHAAPLRLPVHMHRASQLRSRPMLPHSSDSMIRKRHTVKLRGMPCTPMCAHAMQYRLLTQAVLLKGAEHTGFWCRDACQEEMLPVAASGRRPRRWEQAGSWRWAAGCQRSAS